MANSVDHVETIPGSFVSALFTKVFVLICRGKRVGLMVINLPFVHICVYVGERKKSETGKREGPMKRMRTISFSHKLINICLPNIHT